MIKKAIKAGIGQVASLTKLDLTSFASKMMIVAFHRVNDRLPQDSLTINSKMFEDFCLYFMKHFRVVPLNDQIAACQAKQNSGGTLSITFDDGYLDNYEIAAPILQRLGLPATFFITTKFIGSTHIPTWDQRLRFQPGWMTWDHVRDLDARGFSIGGHTETHIDMGKGDNNLIRQELIASKAKAEAELGKPVKLFAYPFGGLQNITEASRDIVKETGFSCCMSCHGGFNPPIADPFRLKRVAISTWFQSPYQFGAELVLGMIGPDSVTH